MRNVTFLEKTRCSPRKKHWIMRFVGNGKIVEVDWLHSRCFNCNHSQMSHDQDKGNCVAAGCECHTFGWGLSFNRFRHTVHSDNLCRGTK